MDAIKQYLDYMFRTLPPTPQAIQARADLLAMMEDKYTELRNEGMPEHQAVAQVISDFGNLEEVAQELNLPTEPISEGAAGTPIMQVGAATAREFMAHRRERAGAIAIGTFLATTGGGALATLTMLSDPDIGLFSEVLGTALGFGIGLLLVAAALFFFLNHPYGDEYEKFSENPLALDYDAKMAVLEERDHYARGIRLKTIFGIGLLLMALFMIFLASVGSDSLWGELGFTIIFGAAVMTVAVGVWMIVHAQSVNNSYKILLEKEDFSREKKEKDPIFEAFSGVYWLSTVLLYLVLGFWNNWDNADITWAIWPTAGVLYAIIAVIWTSITESRGRQNSTQN